MARVTAKLDGIIALNTSSMTEAMSVWPVLAKVPAAVIPHAVYETAYPIPPTKSQARDRFGLTGHKPVVGLIGDLKPYKGLDRVLTSMQEASVSGFTLFVAGALKSSKDQRFVVHKIDSLISLGWDIKFVEGRLSDRDLVTALQACDLVLFPYKSGSNSGLAILAAELGIPMLLADTPAFRELSADICSAYTKISSQDFSGDELWKSALGSQQSGKRAPNGEFLAQRSQARIACLTAKFYKDVITGWKGV